MIRNQITIIKDTVTGNTIRLIGEEVWDRSKTLAGNVDMVLCSHSYKIQIKTSGIIRLFTKYITIKTFNGSIDDYEEDDFAYREARELFNNIINPYKI